MIRASTGEPQVSGVPAPPKAPAPEDFPVVPAVEPPRLERADQAGLVAAITAAVVVAAGLKWVSAGAIETAPILFVAVVAAAWWLDRRASLGVAILSETLAKRLFGNDDPIGKRIHPSRLNPGQVAEPDRVTNVSNWTEIVGVAADVKSLNLDPQIETNVYVPYWQWPMQSPTLAVRTTGNPANLTAAIYGEVKAQKPVRGDKRCTQSGARCGQPIEAKPTY